MIRQLIAPLAFAVVTFHAGQALAQGAFPAPLPGQAAAPNSSPFPPVNGAAPPTAFGTSPAPASFPGAGPGPMSSAPFTAPPTQSGLPDDCMKNFLPLRQETEKRAQLLKAASARHAPPDEACKLITGYTEAELKMIKYVDTNGARCQIPPQIGEQLRNGHKSAEGMRTKICTAATQVQKPAGPSLSDVLGSATQLPEATVAKKSGGGTFDTISGNALTR